MKKIEQRGDVLWIADLRAQKYIVEKCIERTEKELVMEEGRFSLSTQEVLTDRFYTLQLIEEELELAKKYRAEQLLQCPTPSEDYKSIWGTLINEKHDDKEDDDE